MLLPYKITEDSKFKLDCIYEDEIKGNWNVANELYVIICCYIYYLTLENNQ